MSQGFTSRSYNEGSGIAKQVVYFEETEFVSGTTIITIDDTIPQITQGTEGLTASITPTSTSNKLRIDVVMNLGVAATNEQMQMALFQDSTADAIASSTGNWQAVSGETNVICLTHWMDAGTVASTTFSARFGGHGSGTYGMNGSSGRLHGGVHSSSITITEYEA